MREKATPNLQCMLRSLLIAVVMISASPKALAMILIPPDAPELILPDDIKHRLSTLVSRFPAHHPTQKTGFGCIKQYDSDDSGGCMLLLPCSMGMVAVEKNRIAGVGMNSGGDLSADDRCTSNYFLEQAEAITELVGNIPARRAHEIVEAMDRDPKRFGRCPLNDIGQFDEGSGGLSYGKDGQTYGADHIDGRRLVRIFCWHPRQN